MRGGREALTRAGIFLAQETFGLGLDRLAGLGPDALAQLARLGRSEDRDLDEAYADLLKAPGVAAGTGLAPDFLEHNLQQELALAQVEAAASTAALAISDGLRLVRAALYGANGDNQARLTELCADPALSPAERLSLTTSFSEVLRQEGLLQARGAETRRLSAEHEARLREGLQRLDQSAEERADIDNLLRAAADPAALFPAPRRREPAEGRKAGRET
jgi:hypothetical protein